MPADTSSAPAAKTTVVGAAAAALAALIEDPMPARSVAAVATSSGIAITNDISRLPTVRLSPVWSPRNNQKPQQRIVVFTANSRPKWKFLASWSPAGAAALRNYVKNAQDSLVYAPRRYGKRPFSTVLWARAATRTHRPQQLFSTACSKQVIAGGASLTSIPYGHAVILQPARQWVVPLGNLPRWWPHSCRGHDRFTDRKPAVQRTTARQ